MDELIGHIRTAAEEVGTEHFLELLRWHRAVVGLGEFDPHTNGAYRDAIAGLGSIRAGTDTEQMESLDTGLARHSATDSWKEWAGSFAARDRCSVRRVEERAGFTRSASVCTEIRRVNKCS